MQKQITLTIEQAREMLGKDPAMDQLIRANFSEDELKPKPKYPKTWKELGWLDGYRVDANSSIIAFYGATHTTSTKTYATKQQALSFGLIYPQLTQLMKVYRGGWEPDWNDVKMAKYCIIIADGDTRVISYNRYVQHLSFPTRALAQQFLTDHRDLILEFYKGM